MRLLLIHSDGFVYEVREKAVATAEEVEESRKRVEIGETLVAFSAVEKVDEENPESVVKQAVDAIADVASKVKVSRVVVYPYAHLSTELANPITAQEVLKKISEELEKRGFEVVRAPFGWYKSFELRCKGHPLSELSRTIVPVEEEVVEKKEKPEAPSLFLVLEPDGTEHTLDLANIEAYEVLNKYPLLKQFIISEEIGKKPGETPPHIKLMRRLELVDYEPASDIGHFRFYPKGTLIKDLLEDFAFDIAVKDLKAMKIETPMLYRLEEPDIAEQASKFRERDYRFEIDGRELILRFAGDFGLFRMMKDVTMSYRQLPIRVYELTSSFRLEQRGECVGLRRLRGFTMPDIHCFCRDLEQGMDEYKELFRYYTKLADAMLKDYVVAFRVVKDFYEENRKWFAELVQIANKPALIELLPEMKHYWVVKHEYQVIDSVGGNAQLCTVQLDVEDSERYGIFYVDVDGKKKGCIIVHSSMGSIERWIYAILEQAEKMRREGQPPMLPVWLSPTQVRVIPVSETYLEFAEKVADEIERHEIRVDVDDRDETVSSKIRDAEQEWIPYIVVVGEKEAAGAKLSVRVRGVGVVEMTLEELVKEINEDVGDKPRKPLYLPRRLSARPRFA